MKVNRTVTAFTLIEVLLSISLVALLGLAVYVCLNSGLQIWQRANTPYIGEDVNIFFEKLAVDIRNSFPYKGIAFSGTATGFQCASIITTASQSPGLQRGVGEVSYFYDQENKAVIREKRNLSVIFREKGGVSQEVLGKVTEALFQYYYYDPRAKEYFWVDEWPQDRGTPLAVAVRLGITYGSKSYTFSKVIFIPVQ